jgi:hypothetical protein
MRMESDEQQLKEAGRRADPRRAGDVLERVEWRLQYGEYKAPFRLNFLGWIIAILLALILWSVW